MSDNSEATLLVDVVGSVQVSNYFAAAAIGLLAYDFAITFGQEVDLFWKRKTTLSSALFILNRYIPLTVNMIFAPWPSYPTSIQTLEILQYLPWAVFAGLRAYVLSPWKRTAGAIVFLLASVPIIINYITEAWSPPYVDPLFGCSTTTTLTAEMQQKDAREIKLLGQRTSLASVLFRDGVLYFITLLVLNVLHLAFSLDSILNANTTSNASYITILTEPITAILISRFLIDLQEASIYSQSQHSLASVGTLDFNRVVGSVTASLPASGDLRTERMTFTDTLPQTSSNDLDDS
ncbi:uncharacterized protein BXZ73DRAFT_97233 [Epithele typhae]|uniref:uncharacterized protein n=1 Tax=Epithele typhae TaxID=378194 RepID=UPI0020083146|nr:uncharacterized protein BXZ73DRAFT_97233 [Epithele typhae]KAH9943180.1 hypothetical protein BXZ73DRAFT_97233 [Epithele typhae]